jgi:hypothetical protein
MNQQSSLVDNEINFESLSEYLTKRYPDLEISFDKKLGELQAFINELKNYGFSPISEVHKILERTQKAVELYEMEFPPNGKGSQHSCTGIARISMCLLDRNFTLRDMKVEDIPPEKLEEYRKHILPERE